MELRHLRYFLVVAEEENFHRAAERLHVSQSPLSRQIKDLERELRVQLLQPQGRGIKLTDAGRRFAERARVLLRNADDAATEARDVAEGRQGTITIGFETGTSFLGRLANLLMRFRARMPGITIQLAPMTSAEQWEALRTGRIAMGYGFYAPSDNSLGHLEVSRDRLGVVLATNHRLASKKKVRVTDLANERVLLQPRALYPRLHDDIISTARARGIVLDIVREVMDGEALLTLVAIGDGVSFFAESKMRIIHASLVHEISVWRPLDWDVHETDVILWQREEASKPVVRTLLECAKEILPPRPSRSTRLSVPT